MSGFAAMAAKRDELYAHLAWACRTVLKREHQPGPPEVPLWTMPLDHESSDEEIAAVMAGHIGSEIVWTNSISSKDSHAKLIRFRSVTRQPDGRDYIDVLTDEGFHAIYIRQIVSIG